MRFKTYSSPKLSSKIRVIVQPFKTCSLMVSMSLSLSRGTGQSNTYLIASTSVLLHVPRPPIRQFKFGEKPIHCPLRKPPLKSIPRIRLNPVVLLSSKQILVFGSFNARERSIKEGFVILTLVMYLFAPISPAWWASELITHGICCCLYTKCGISLGLDTSTASTFHSTIFCIISSSDLPASCISYL